MIIYVPCDSASLAVGADEVALAIQAEADRRGLSVELRRNSSRGLFWLEPLVEVVTPVGRIAFGPVAVEDVAGLFDANWAASHPLHLGCPEDMPYLQKTGAPDLRPHGYHPAAVVGRLRGA